MNAGKAIYYLLANNAGVSAITTRIYPEVAPQDAAAPFIVYRITSVSPDDTHDGPATIDEVRLEVICVSETYDQAADMGSVSRVALDRVYGTYNTVNVESIQFDDVAIYVRDQPRQYGQELTFTIRVKRDDVQIATGSPIEDLTLGRLADVDTTGATNDQVLTYDSATDSWSPEDASTVAGINDLTDVELGQVSEGEILKWDGDFWVNDSLTVPTSLNDLSDVTISGTPPANRALVYNPTSQAFVPSAAYTNRFEDDVERGIAGIVPFVERAYSVKAEGDGIFLDQQGDTPSSGNFIQRKIWHKSDFVRGDDVISRYTLIHTFADDTAYASTTDTFEAFQEGSTYGTPPYTLIQTWEQLPIPTTLLATYPGAAAAYSLRLIGDGSYTGDAIRVRRASDNAEQDINFDSNGDLDTTSLATFCSGTDGFVKTWYDQSGNANDATQTTTGDQPKIYDSATGVVTENGKPAVQGTTASQLSMASSILGLGDYSVFTTHVFSIDDMFYGGNSPTFIWDKNGGLQQRFDDGTNFGFTASYANGDRILSYQNRDTGLVSIAANGSTATTGTNTAAFTIDRLLAGFGTTAYSFAGKVQEFVFYELSQSSNRTGIESNINDNYLIHSQSPTGLLADYPGAAAAYSLRQLISTAQLAIAVRRDSDDAVLGIGFVNGELDTTTLATFCSGANGFVAVWFDQSGNSNDATQTTTTNQPKIYDSTGGVIESGSVGNENPALSFDGINDRYVLDTSGLDIGSLSSFTVGEYRSTTGSGEMMLSLSGSNAARRWYAPFLVSGNFAYGYANSSTAITTTADANQNLHVMIAGATLGNAEAWLNSVSAGTTSRISAASSNENGIANYVNGFYADCFIQEIIYYNSDQSSNRTGIETNINDYYNIYTP